MILPPCQVRPNLKDYSANNALDNLRVRRLNTISGGRSAAASSAVVPKVLERRSTVPTHINSVENNKESWIGRRDDPSCPAGGPKRRRPVSASALNQFSETSPTRSGGDNRRGFGTAEMAEELYAQPSGAEHIGQRFPVTHRRPCSAKAALQKPEADRQVRDSLWGRQRNNLCKIKTLLRMRDSQRVKQSSPNCIDDRRVARDAVEDNGEREPVNVIPQDARIARHLPVRETNQRRESTGGFRRKSECEDFATNQHTLSPVGHEEMEEERVPREEDQVWLLDR